LARTASAGFSCISTVVVVTTRSSPAVSSSAGPKITGRIDGDAASSAPATTSSGARSPPRASTATLTGIYPAQSRIRFIADPRRAGPLKASAFAAAGSLISPPLLYAAGVRSGSISRPRYVLHVGQTRCGCFACPQVGQVLTRGAEMACCARRLSRRAFEVFLLGTAMSGCGV
jgi:hypothetical protein